MSKVWNGFGKSSETIINGRKNNFTCIEQSLACADRCSCVVCENHQKMMALTERAAAWKPQLTEYMKDKTFALIYQDAIARTTKEI